MDNSTWHKSRRLTRWIKEGTRREERHEARHKLLNIQAWIDAATGDAGVRAMRWPDGGKWPHGGSAAITQRGVHNEQAPRQRDACHAGRRQGDDLTGTILAGQHQPVGGWVVGRYCRGLNLSNAPLAADLDLDPDGAQAMTPPSAGGRRGEQKPGQ